MPWGAWVAVQCYFRKPLAVISSVNKSNSRWPGREFMLLQFHPDSLHNTDVTFMTFGGRRNVKDLTFCTFVHGILQAYFSLFCEFCTWCLCWCRSLNLTYQCSKYNAN